MKFDDQVATTDEARPGSDPAITTFAATCGLLSPVEPDFQGSPGRKTTQTESDG